MAKTCKICRSELQPILLPDFTGNDRTLYITFSNVPALVCREGHEKKMVDGEFPIYVLQTVLKKVPKSNVKGFAKKQHFCNKCGALLDPKVLANEHFQIQIDWKGMKPFGADVAAPSAKCSACLTVQMVKTRELEQEEIPNAIVKAFDSIQLKR